MSQRCTTLPHTAFCIPSSFRDSSVRALLKAPLNHESNEGFNKLKSKTFHVARKIFVYVFLQVTVTPNYP